MEAGEGEPLIIVPATISELENWRALTQFTAQWFHSYFFELPGHGQSSPFEGKFSSVKVAHLIEQLVDALEIERFNLMGFSFGGILALQAHQHLAQRINRMLLIAPCVDHRAVQLSPFRSFVLYQINKFLQRPGPQARFNEFIHNEHTVPIVAKALRRFGNVENSIALERKLPQTPWSTYAVLNAQIEEILTTEFETPSEPHSTPCYFAMSINDPLLCFDTTQGILKEHFLNLQTVRLTYPFHQPPRQFTYEELNHDFYQSVDRFVSEIQNIGMESLKCDLSLFSN